MRLKVLPQHVDVLALLAATVPEILAPVSDHGLPSQENICAVTSKGRNKMLPSLPRAVRASDMLLYVTDILLQLQLYTQHTFGKIRYAAVLYGLFPKLKLNFV